MPQPWPAEKRDEALRLYVDLGPSEASRLTGIPKGTIAAWAHRSGTHTVCAATTQAAVDQAALSREQRVARLASDLLAIAEDRAAMVRAGIADAVEEVKRTTVMAIAIDKAQLLAGEATSRTETLDVGDAQAELDRLQEQWRQRRAGAA